MASSESRFVATSATANDIMWYMCNQGTYYKGVITLSILLNFFQKINKKKLHYSNNHSHASFLNANSLYSMFDSLKTFVKLSSQYDV